MNHIIGNLNRPLSNGNHLGNGSLLPPLPPSIGPLAHHSMSRPLSINIGTVGNLLAVNGNRHIKLVTNDNIKGDILLKVVAHRAGTSVIIIKLVKRHKHRIGRFVSRSLNTSKLTGSVIIITPTSRSPLVHLGTARLYRSVTT